MLRSINLVDEGYWDGATVFDWFRRQARERGVEYVENEVVAITRNADGNRVESVTLKSGEMIACGKLSMRRDHVRHARPAWQGLIFRSNPQRFTWVFKADKPLDRFAADDRSSGVHVREIGGGTYQAGGHSDFDPPVDPEDFDMDHSLWENHIWPAIANRILPFQAIKVTSEWAGHYSMNTLDQNAIIGPHPEIANFLFVNGFSGHGLQQSPAMGRGTAEWLVHGEYRSLDLSPFHFDRVQAGRAIVEKAII
ncbi:MAG: FAD-binding oxidoreductase [Nitratireductor sp.]